MKNTQRGFIIPLVIAIVVMLGIGGYVYNQKLNLEIKNSIIQKDSTTTENIKAENTRDKTEETNIGTTSTEKGTEALIDGANKVKDKVNNSVGKKIITDVKVTTDSARKTGTASVIDPKIVVGEMLKNLKNKNAYIRDLLNRHNTQISWLF